MRLLVGHAYFMAHDPKQHAKARPYPPLSTLYAAGLLRSAGHDVVVFDAMLSAGVHEFVEALDSHRPHVVVIAEDNFNFLSKMCLGRVRDTTIAMIGAAVERGCRVIVGGSDATDHPEPFLAAGAEAVAVGEYEHTLVETVAAIAAAAPLTEIAGLVRRGPLGPEPGPRRPNERHPDSFGTPARDLVDHDRYRRVWTEAHGRFSTNMVSTRGCPFHCNWCAKPIWGQRYAMRSAAAVAAELHEVRRTLAPDHVWFADDIFGLRASWLAEFADEIERLGTQLPFTIQSRADLMTPAAVDALRRSGCETVWLGAESGSQRILDAMDKGITVAQIRTARERLGAAGIRAAFFIQFGYPGEGWDDIEATIDLVRATRPDEIGVSVSYPLPGTRFHAMVRDQLGDKTHWDDSGDLEMMFRGTYSSDFYRDLHRALHLELDLAHGVAVTGLDEAWDSVRSLERSGRNRRPTLLVRTEAMPPAPDLAEAYG